MTEFVEDELPPDEWLLRNFPVPDNRMSPPVYHFRESEDGFFPVSRTAFNDKACQPSVDREVKLTDPAQAKHSVDDAIVRLQAQDVIALSNTVRNDEKVFSRRHYVVDDPTASRPAHAKIMSNAAITLVKGKPASEAKYWKNFQELLAAAASRYGWVIAPNKEHIEKMIAQKKLKK